MSIQEWQEKKAIYLRFDITSDKDMKDTVDFIEKFAKLSRFINRIIRNTHKFHRIITYKIFTNNPNDSKNIRYCGEIFFPFKGEVTLLNLEINKFVYIIICKEMIPALEFYCKILKLEFQYV